MDKSLIEIEDISYTYLDFSDSTIGEFTLSKERELTHIIVKFRYRAMNASILIPFRGLTDTDDIKEIKEYIKKILER